MNEASAHEKAAASSALQLANARLAELESALRAHKHGTALKELQQANAQIAELERALNAAAGAPAAAPAAAESKAPQWEPILTAVEPAEMQFILPLL